MSNDSPQHALAKSLEVLIDTTTLDPKGWIEYPEYGFRQYFLWKNPATGASIALLEYEKGGRIRHHIDPDATCRGVTST